MKKQFLTLAAIVAATVSANAQMQVTEVMYTGLFGELVEVTNIGGSNVDIQGWTYGDSGSSRLTLAPSGTVFNVVPNQAIIISEISDTVFDIVWYDQPTETKPANLLFYGDVTINLGRADAVRIFNPAVSTTVPVTSVTYSDPANGPRSEDVSMIPNNLTTVAANSQGSAWKLSTNDPAAWKAGNPAANGPFASPGYYTTP